MKLKLISILSTCLVFFVASVFADMPGGGVRWPSQTIKLKNISSLGQYVLYIPSENARKFYSYWDNDYKIIRDTTLYCPEPGGAPGNGMSFFAVLNQKNTDTIAFTENIEITFTGVKNNKIQFSSKKIKGDVGIAEPPNNLDESGIHDGVFTSSETEKFLIGVSVAGLLGLILFFLLPKLKRKLVSIKIAG